MGYNKYLEQDQSHQTTLNFLWHAEMKVEDEKINLGFFKYKRNAQRAIEKRCKELTLKGKYPQNYFISEKSIDELKSTEKCIQIQTSKYNGVSWKKDRKKWQARLGHDKKIYSGGYFDNENHAAMRINLLCEKFGIKRKNPTIDIKPDPIQQRIPNQTSKYNGVYWNKQCRKWRAYFRNNKKQYHGGMFASEEQAAMKVNLFCDKFDVERKNPTIDMQIDVIQQIRNQTSTYYGVSWSKKSKKWEVQFKHNQKNFYGGVFDNEEHAAMKVNLLCEKFGIKQRNLEITTIIHAIQKKTKSKIDESNEKKIL